MESKEESLIVRSLRLHQSVLLKNGQMHNVSTISYDALLDSFFVLFDECTKDGLKKDINILKFVKKYKNLVSKIKSLRISLNDFELMTVIGRGYFGEVRLAKEKATGDTYSLKKINKLTTLKNASTALYEEERDILSCSTSHWHTKLQYAFQDSHYLYLVMEYHPGGDLFALLEREGGRLPIEHVRFYLAETLLAINDLHNLGYVHRDVKPENLLLDRCGHIKLADFGSAAHLKDGRVTTAMPAGTPDYLAPEVLKTLEEGCEKNKSTYGVECDFWSLGVLAYALAVGASPFAGPRTSVTYSKILKHRNSIVYPDGISVTDSLKALINGLLNTPDLRLNFSSTRKHNFFAEIDFTCIHQVLPPHVPVVSSPEDTSNFACEPKTTEPVVTPRENQREFSGRQLPFIGFTFTPAQESSKTKTAETLAPERHTESLEAMKKTNQELLAKILASKELSAERIENSASRQLERSEKERVALQKELAKEKQEISRLLRIIEKERLDRKHDEEEALARTRARIEGQDREYHAAVQSRQAKIEELTDRLTKQHTINNELVSRCDRAENEVAALRVEYDCVREKLAKAREYNRRSVTNIDSQLDKLRNDCKHREHHWQEKLHAEVDSREVVISLLQAEKSKWLDEKTSMVEQTADLASKINILKAELTKKIEAPADKSKEKYLEDQLAMKNMEASQLKIKIMKLETELSNTNQSFMEIESNGQREYTNELELELKKVSQEKIELQSQLQTVKEQVKDNNSKLMDVMKKLGAVEQDLIKLEKENATLKEKKMDEGDGPQLSLQLETQYKQKILLLEGNVDKLEGQIEKLRESAIIEKQELRSTLSKLYKLEKELSDTKIDVRIAKRETKTAEDEVKKLQEEVKQLQARAEAVEVETNEIIEAGKSNLNLVKTELKRKDEEIAMLKKVQSEVERLSTAEKQLQCEYNSLRQQQQTSDRQLSSCKAELETVQKEYQSTCNEKISLTAVMEELRSKISSLELNNSCLKEAAAMLDEQVADYEAFTADQTSKMQVFQLENVEMKRKLNQLQEELAATKTTLAEMREARTNAENKAATLETQVGDKSDAVHELRVQLEHFNKTIEKLTAQLTEKETANSELEIELYNKDRLVEALQSDLLWLKEETSAHLTNFYAMKEANEKLNQDLDDETKFSSALQERLREQEQAVKELEAFHSQREMKDGSTMQQQNKLIDFLQTKLQESKRKKTLAVKLFGHKQKDLPTSPQAPKVTSPTPGPSKSTENLRKKVLGPSHSASNSPRTCQAASQLVDSPTTRMQRQASLPRMHHKIPHRFKTQRSASAGKCVGCYDVIPRGATRVSVCVHCNVPAHPKCALTAPKTCGLPPAFAQHFAKTVEKPKEDSASPGRSGDGMKTEGWVDILAPGETGWKRQYARIEGSKLLFFENKPDALAVPSRVWDLAATDGQLLVSDTVTATELPSAAKSDLRFVIKIACIPSTTCWPTQTHYLLILTPADKPKWVAALQSAYSHTATKAKLAALDDCSTVLFEDNSGLGINCTEQITDQIILLGCDKGLFSLRKSSQPVQLHGVTSVHSLALAPHINTALLIVGENRVLVSADCRSLVSNAEAAACSSPGIKTSSVGINSDDPVLHVKISDDHDDHVYLTVAIPSKVIVMKWDLKKYDFVVLRTLDTNESCSCILYHGSSVILGCQTFFSISLKDFSVNEMLGRTAMNSSFVRLRSYPMYVAAVSSNEFLLCYKEFGLFVNGSGDKTRPDLKWANVPRAFVYCEPYLFIIGISTVELLKLDPVPEVPSSDDSSSISTVVTLKDNLTLTFNNPVFLGIKKKAGIFLRTDNKRVALLEGAKLDKNPLGSRGDLLRTTSEGQFSFTSSLIGSLDEFHSDEEIDGDGDSIRHTAL